MLLYDDDLALLAAKSSTNYSIICYILCKKENVHMLRVLADFCDEYDLKVECFQVHNCGVWH